MIGASAYPQEAAERSRWIVERRGAQNKVAIDQPFACLVEKERQENGRIAEVATIFLTNRECPWKCVMCDLWRNAMPVPPGSIPKQIEFALAKLPRISVLKLYNSGSFFDAGAIPKSDWKSIAALVRGFEHVIVECHPRLVGGNVAEFAGMLDGTMEVALGLETCHPQALEKLNKRITLEHYREAATFLRANEMGVRTFLLAGVPFIRPEEQQHWVQQSMVESFDAGSQVVSLIPTRKGNGAMEELEIAGEFVEPCLSTLEEAQEFGLNLKRGRVFADTWDIEGFTQCGLCAPERRDRMERMNLSQQAEIQVRCDCEE